LAIIGAGGKEWLGFVSFDYGIASKKQIIFFLFSKLYWDDWCWLFKNCLLENAQTTVLDLIFTLWRLLFYFVKNQKF
jgi:hypothetical protein